MTIETNKTMIQFIKTDSSNQDFKNLVKELDAYLKIVDGEDHDFYNQYNGLEELKHVLVAYDEKQPVGCGTFKKVNEISVEIKRMYLKRSHRGTGIASQILTRLEMWAKEIGFQKIILETGSRQVEFSSYPSFPAKTDLWGTVTTGSGAAGSVEIAYDLTLVDD